MSNIVRITVLGLFLGGLCIGRASANLLTNPGAETGNLTGWTVGGSSNPGIDNGSFNPGINPYSGNFDFYGHTGSSGTLTQNVNLLSNGFITGQIDSGTLLANLTFFEQGLNQGNPSDDASVSLTFLNASSTSLGIVSSGEIDSHNGTWQGFNGDFSIPVGTRSIDYTMNFIRHVGADLDAYIDNNSLTVSAVSTVPEPSTWLLLATGLLGLLGYKTKQPA